MSARSTQRLPGYRYCAGDDVAQVPPQIVEHDGEPFLVVHAPGFTTALLKARDRQQAVAKTLADAALRKAGGK